MSSSVHTAKKLLRSMAMLDGSIVPMPVMWQTGSGVARMSKEQFKAEKMYQTTMSIAKNLLEQGFISADEYKQIDTIFTDKYTPILGSLFADIDLITPAIHGNM